MRADGSRRPLGVLALQTQFRHSPARRLSNKESRANPQRRTFKWGIGVSAVEEVLDGATSAIHLMDREADAYEVLAGLGQKGHRFVVRVRQERLVRGENGKSKLLLDALEGVSSVLVREVPLTARSPKRINPKHCHPPRRERLASLHFRARAVILPRPPYGDPANKALPATLAVNIVHVFEATPPSGEPPIEWLLATSEPVDTVEQVEPVVDWYRTRYCGCSLVCSLSDAIRSIMRPEVFKRAATRPRGTRRASPDDSLRGRCGTHSGFHGLQTGRIRPNGDAETFATGC